ncbi:MAG: 23S rRNA (guanosine(2251)-2'-O)-methyltransferase RlmB [Alphaproteobacteria bacterium]|nr:23S rRNA (guanosine(2251)-2'-O)-methyltransferase RlmB [Alphaproteobacteria bacterium]
MSSVVSLFPMKNDKKFKKYPKKDKQPRTPKLKINLFGQHAVREAWMNPTRKFKKLYLTDKTAEGFEELLHSARKNGLDRPTPQIVTRAELDKSLGGDTVHQGIAALSSDLPERNALDLIIKHREDEHSVFVLLDQVTDPHNVGAIMRSAVAFGLKGMVLQNRFTPPLEGTLAKVACGGIEHLPVAQEVNLSRAIETFKDHGYTCIALDERGEKTFKGLDPSPKKAVLVMGAEGPGLRPSVRDACQEVVRLEMKGPLPSINVSNAAAISFYALTS